MAPESAIVDPTGADDPVIPALPPKAGESALTKAIVSVNRETGHASDGVPPVLNGFLTWLNALDDKKVGGRVRFDFTGLRAQWSSHCVAYQLFGQAAASLQDHFARERAFPSEEGSVYYLPSEVFSRAKLILAPVTRGFLTLLLTVLNPVTLRRLLHKVGGPVHGSLRKL